MDCSTLKQFTLSGVSRRIPLPLWGKRNKVFERNRDYANGNQDTSIYKQLLNSLSPNKGDGSLLNLDFTPVPILPKFVRVVANKILSRNPYPNLESVDPLSSSEKNKKKDKLRVQVENRAALMTLKESTGLVLDMDPEELPESLEEAEIFLDTNIKTDAEVAAQIATNMTLQWSNFNDTTYRRCVNDIVSLGLAVTKETTTPPMVLMFNMLTQSTSSTATQRTTTLRTLYMLGM